MCALVVSFIHIQPFQGWEMYDSLAFIHVQPLQGWVCASGDFFLYSCSTLFRVGGSNELITVGNAISIKKVRLEIAKRTFFGFLKTQ